MHISHSLIRNRAHMHVGSYTRYSASPTLFPAPALLVDECRCIILWHFCAYLCAYVYATDRERDTQMGLSANGSLISAPFLWPFSPHTNADNVTDNFNHVRTLNANASSPLPSANAVMRCMQIHFTLSTFLGGAATAAAAADSVSRKCARLNLFYDQFNKY